MHFKARRPTPAPAWLQAVRKVHALMDMAVANARDRRIRETAQTTACASGCDHCCRQPIPASAPELAAALWHLAALTPAAARAQVLAAMANMANTANMASTANMAGATGQADQPGRPGADCPFLVNGQCSVYPFRFLACRQFMIFGPPCRQGEDVWTTRRPDLLLPTDALKLRALSELAALYRAPPNMDPTALRRFVMDVSAPVQHYDLGMPGRYLHLMDNGLLRYAGPGSGSGSEEGEEAIEEEIEQEARGEEASGGRGG